MLGYQFRSFFTANDTARIGGARGMLVSSAIFTGNVLCDLKRNHQNACGKFIMACGGDQIDCRHLEFSSLPANIESHHTIPQIKGRAGDLLGDRAAKSSSRRAAEGASRLIKCSVQIVLRNRDDEQWLSWDTG